MAGGGGGGATVNVEPISKEAAECWGYRAVQEHETQQFPVTQAYAAILSLIGTVGLIRQWDALDRSLDLAERQTDTAEDYYDLSLRNYEEVTIRAFECQKELFDRYTADFADCADIFVALGKDPKEYVAGYALYGGRAAAGVGAQFSRLRQRRQRQRSKYATGACCNENLQLDIAQAVAMTEAKNRGYRYEDQRKIQLDQWYWSKCESVATFVSQMRAHVISGVNSGVANATGSIGAVGGAVGAIGQAGASQQGALENIASFFGSLSNGAFRLAGGFLGYNSIGNGSQFNLPGFQSVGPQTPTTDSFIGGSGSGYVGGKLSPVGTAVAEPSVWLGGPNVVYSLCRGYIYGT